MRPDLFVKKKFSEYYQRERSIDVPNIHQREFGVGSWEKKIEMRHMSFNSLYQLKDYLINDTPFYISYSAAYYRYPDARPMEKKEWLGADLIFDLDADREECGRFTSKECLEEVKERTIKLIEDFLIADFGFSKDEIKVNFSGSKGYHVHITDEVVRSLSAKERKQIVDYITGKGLSYDALFSEGKKVEGPKPSDGGYRGRFARQVIEQLRNDRKFRTWLHRRLSNPLDLDWFIKGIEEGNWSRLKIVRQREKFEKVIQTLGIRLSDQIDTQVTMDTARLIRLPNSLHGGSSLLAKRISVNDLDRFDPMNDAVVFGSRTVRVKIVEDVPELVMKNETFGPFKQGRTVELPEYVALYLLCKKAAE